MSREFSAVYSDAAPAPAARVHGTLIQVMRSIMFPNSNVIFAAQTTNPATNKLDASPFTSTNPLTGVYGGWLAVEDSSIALAEAANLPTIPGRSCGNGRPVPIQNAEWPMFVQGLRDAGMAAYKAAQSKNEDAILEAAGTVAEACAACHGKYLDVPGGMPNRCQ